MKINKDELIAAYREALKRDIEVEKVLEEWGFYDQKGKRRKRAKNLKRVPFIILIVVGCGFILTAFLPSLSFWWNEKVGQENHLLSPIPDDRVLAQDTKSKTKKGQPVSISEDIRSSSQVVDEEQPVIMADQIDYNNLANWFEGGQLSFSQTTDNSIGAEDYFLDIPKLNISKAKVKYGGTNLNNSLIHYESTAQPGEAGAPVIFGHSSLRQWYNPSENNPERYRTIFSTIMTLEKGDKIYLTQNGKIYTYQVISKENVKPTEVDKIIGQDTSGKFLKLITCTPEGTTAMRGIVTAQLVETEVAT